MTISVLVVAGVVTACLGLVWLLPKTAVPDDLDLETGGHAWSRSVLLVLDAQNAAVRPVGG